jgi:hypothetical protein
MLTGLIQSHISAQIIRAHCDQHATTVLHHFAARASYASCQHCGCTASPIHWPTADMPADVCAQALARFATEFPS